MHFLRAGNALNDIIQQFSSDYSPKLSARIALCHLFRKEADKEAFQLIAFPDGDNKRISDIPVQIQDAFSDFFTILLFFMRTIDQIQNRVIVLPVMIIPCVNHSGGHLRNQTVLILHRFSAAVPAFQIEFPCRAFGIYCNMIKRHH